MTVPNPISRGGHSEGVPTQSQSRAAGRGLLWMTLNSGVTRVAAVMAQLALGWKLGPQDFGVYALAISFATFFTVFQEGGVRLFLVQRGLVEYPSLANQGFWLALTSASTAALALALLTPLAAAIFHQEELRTILWVIAASLPLSAFAVVNLAKLQLQLRFKSVARIEFSTAILQYTSLVAFAFLGFGPLAFVLPLPLIGVYGAFAAYIAGREAPWRTAPHPRTWPAMIRDTKWLLLGSLANNGLRQGDNLGLGFVAPAAALGVYFFAFQLTFEAANLIMTNAYKVLVPALAPTIADPAKRRSGILRSARAISMIACPTLVTGALLIGDLESVFWQGKWQGAVAPMRVFFLALPFQVLALFSQIVLVAAGRFRLWSVIALTRGVGVVPTAIAAWTLAANISNSPNSRVLVTVVCVASYYIVTGLIMTRAVLRPLNVNLISLLRATGPAYLGSLVAALVAALVASSLSLNSKPLLRLAVLIVVFSIVFLFLGRRFLRHGFNELVAILPLGAADRVRRHLYLGSDLSATLPPLAKGE